MNLQLQRPFRLWPEMRATIRLGSPLIAGQLIAISMNTIDVLLAGHLGASVLGAVAIGTSIWTPALVAALGVMMSLPPSVAQLDGAGRRDETAALFRQALWLVAVIGAGLQQALWSLGPMLARAIAIDPGMLADVEGFLRAISFAAPAVCLFFACRGLSDGLSMTAPTMVFSIIGPVTLLPAGYALMYGALGLPALGAAGLGIATSVAFWLMALSYLGFILRSPRYRGIGWARGPRRPDLKILGGLLRIGLPIAVSTVLETTLFSAAGLVIGSFGAVIVAGHQVALNVAVITFMVPLGVSMATRIRVGNAVGRNDAAGTRRAGLVGLTLGLMTQSVSAAAMLLMPRAIAAVFTDDPAVADAAAGLLRLAGIFQLADGVQVISAGALRGLKDTRVPMLITGVAYWGVGMPVGWYLTYPAGLAATGMWIGLIAGLATAAILLFTRFEFLSNPATVAAAALRLAE